MTGMAAAHHTLPEACARPAQNSLSRALSAASELVWLRASGTRRLRASCEACKEYAQVGTAKDVLKVLVPAREYLGIAAVLAAGLGICALHAFVAADYHYAHADFLL